MLAGAFLAGIAGLLKATVGAHEVITTIMLNWIASGSGSFLFGSRRAVPDAGLGCAPVVGGRRTRRRELPVIWGDPLLQGAARGIFVAVAALVVY